MTEYGPTINSTAGVRWRFAAAAVAVLAVATVVSTRGQGPQTTRGGERGARAVITVKVSHPVEEGEVACALFASAAGFPDAASKSRGVVHPAHGAATTCTFGGVAPGTYAVAVLLDTNRNGRADTNFLGMPTEPWGVSNDARPLMRAPNFDEASFSVAAGAKLTVAVELK